MEIFENGTYSCKLKEIMIYRDTTEIPTKNDFDDEDEFEIEIEVNKYNQISFLEINDYEDFCNLLYSYNHKIKLYESKNNPINNTGHNMWNFYLLIIKKIK